MRRKERNEEAVSVSPLGQSLARGFGPREKLEEQDEALLLCSGCSGRVAPVTCLPLQRRPGKHTLSSVLERRRPNAASSFKKGQRPGPERIPGGRPHHSQRCSEGGHALRRLMTLTRRADHAHVDFGESSDVCSVTVPVAVVPLGLWFVNISPVRPQQNFVERPQNDNNPSGKEEKKRLWGREVCFGA